MGCLGQLTVLQELDLQLDYSDTFAVHEGVSVQVPTEVDLAHVASLVHLQSLRVSARQVANLQLVLSACPQLTCVRLCALDVLNAEPLRSPSLQQLWLEEPSCQHMPDVYGASPYVLSSGLDLGGGLPALQFVSIRSIRLPRFAEPEEFEQFVLELARWPVKVEQGRLHLVGKVSCDGTCSCLLSEPM
jgi:hypothetical protein